MGTIHKLEAAIEKHADELDWTVNEIKKTEDDIIDMKKVRKEENEAFLQGKKDDEDAITLLNQAKGIMTDFYSKHDIRVGLVQGGEGVDFLQHRSGQGPEFAKSEDTAPDLKLSHKGHRKLEGKGVLALL